MSDDFHHILPGREPQVFKEIVGRLKPGDTFVDAGANIGFYTAVGARNVGKQGRVVSIEMMPDTAEILRSPVRINDLTVVEKPLPDRSGELLTAYVEEGKCGQASIDRQDRGRSQLVESVTLDELLADHETIHLMKMDLEGADHAALRGAESVLGRTNAIILESWAGRKEAERFLLSRGFSIRELSRRDKLAVRG